MVSNRYVQGQRMFFFDLFNSDGSPIESGAIGYVQSNVIYIPIPDTRGAAVASFSFINKKAEFGLGSIFVTLIRDCETTQTTFSCTSRISGQEEVIFDDSLTIRKIR